MIISVRVICLVISLMICTNAWADKIPTTNFNNGASFAVGFSPNGDSLDLILQSIDSAKKTIDVAAYSFTSKPIADALYQASKRGVVVRVVADMKANKSGYSAVTYLANHGISVRLDGEYPIFHHKFMLIDGDTLETGSFNYSKAAATKNAENVLVLYNVPQITKEYKSQWQKLWNEATPLPRAY